MNPESINHQSEGKGKNQFEQYLINKKVDVEYFDPKEYIDADIQNNIKNEFLKIGWDAFTEVLQNVQLRIHVLKEKDLSDHQLQKKLEIIISDYNSLVERVRYYKNLFNEMNYIQRAHSIKLDSEPVAAIPLLIKDSLAITSEIGFAEVHQEGRNYKDVEFCVEGIQALAVDIKKYSELLNNEIDRSVSSYKQE